MSEQISSFDQELTEYKRMVTLRQGECLAIAHVLDSEAANLSRKATASRITLIVLGAVVATKSAIELTMLPGAPRPVSQVVTVVFLLLGVIISVIAAMQAAFRYESKVGELRSLSSVCNSYDRRFMTDYKRYVNPEDQAVTLARLQALVELQDDAIDSIRRQVANLGVDLRSVEVSYGV